MSGYSPLPTAEKFQPHVEGSGLPSAIRQKQGASEHVIHVVRIAAVSDVIEPEPPCPHIVQKRKLALEVQVYVEVRGQARAIRRAY